MYEGFNHLPKYNHEDRQLVIVKPVFAFFKTKIPNLAVFGIYSITLHFFGNIKPFSLCLAFAWQDLQGFA
jgi:hypothetical protein